MSRRSVRVTVPPLAFWTGERIERAARTRVAHRAARRPAEAPASND